MPEVEINRWWKGLLPESLVEVLLEEHGMSIIVCVFDLLRIVEKHLDSAAGVVSLIGIFAYSLPVLFIFLVIWYFAGFLYSILFLHLTERFSFLYARSRGYGVQHYWTHHWWIPGPVLIALDMMSFTRDGMLDCMYFFKVYLMDTVEKKLNDNASECQLKMNTLNREDDPLNFFDVAVPKDIKNLIMKLVFDEGSIRHATEWTIAECLTLQMDPVKKRLGMDNEDLRGAIQHICGFAFGPMLRRSDTDKGADKLSLSFGRDHNGYFNQVYGTVNVSNGITMRELGVDIKFCRHQGRHQRPGMCGTTLSMAHPRHRNTRNIGSSIVEGEDCWDACYI